MGIPGLKFLLANFLIFLVCSVAIAQSQKAAEAEIQQMMQKMDVAGLSVAVVKKGKLFYTHSFGFKDLENKTLLRDTDVFRIASISKSFSATAIMQLVEAGKLSLSDDFGKLVGFKIRNPKFPDRVITLKMIMSHTSSINDSEGYFNLDVINPDKNPKWANCYSDYAPGEGYRYCNLNYNMVGAVIEKTSGQRIDSYVKSHILNPLGLYGGYCIDSLDGRRFVTLYTYDSASRQLRPDPDAYKARREELKSYVLGYSTPLLSPTGGMKISATDLAKYMTMHMNQGKYKGGRLISKKSAALMQTKISDSENYGLALLSTDDMIPGKVMSGHTGSAYGLYSAMFFNPKDKFGIVVITNGCNPSYTRGFNDVLRYTVNCLYDNLVK